MNESLAVSTPVTLPVGKASVVRSPPREGWTPAHVQEDRWRRWSRHLLEEWWSDAKKAAYNLSRRHLHWPPREKPWEIGSGTQLRLAAAWERTG